MNSNVASLELCKALYEVSGLIEDGRHPDSKPEDGFVPRYSLGFLLRKLPARIIKGLGNSSQHAFLTMEKFNPIPDGEDRYTFFYRLQRDAAEAYACTNTTPENAACSIAIELIKQGVLAKTEIKPQTPAMRD